MSNAGLPIIEEETARHFLQANRHAYREYQKYRKEVGREHALMKELMDGDKVVLWACQRFPGWTNHVESAEIEVWALDELFGPG